MIRGDTFKVPKEHRAKGCPAYLTWFTPEDGDFVLDAFVKDATGATPEDKYSLNYTTRGCYSRLNAKDGEKWHWAVDATDEEIAACEIAGEPCGVQYD